MSRGIMVSRLQTVGLLFHKVGSEAFAGRGLSRGREGVDFWPRKQLVQRVERGAC